MKKRRFGLILCIVLCLSLIPMSAFADAGTPNVISEVTITVPTLSGGQTVASLIPVCTAKAGGETLSNVAFFSADWEVQNDSVWEPLADTDTFVAGRTYRMKDPMLYLAGGYTFDSNVVITLNGNDVTPTVDVDVVYFEPQSFVATCTVSFEMNGHGIAPIPQFDADGSLVEPTEPSDDVYAFAGWFADASLTQPVTFPAIFTVDTTLYASWKPRVKTVDITVTQAKYTRPEQKLEASYTVDGSTDNTSAVFEQYTSRDGSSWKQIYLNSAIPYDSQNKIEVTVSLTDSDARMIDESTEVTIHGADGAECDIQKTADSVKITVIYVLPPQKFTVRFDTGGHTPAIPDQEVDALTAPEMPDMSDYTEGAWQFDYWYWGEDSRNYLKGSDVVWEDCVLTAGWKHYTKVTFVMSTTGEEIECWYRSDNMLTYWLRQLEKDGKYYIREAYADKEMTQMIHDTTHITDDVTLYVDAPLYVRELDFAIEEPSDGRTMNPAVRITNVVPENSVEIETLGQWYVSDDGSSWRAMETGEKYAGGHFYYYSEAEFRLTDRNRYNFHCPDLVIRRNDNECKWVRYNTGLVEKAYYVLPGIVEFELNGHGKFIRSQDVQPMQKAVRPDDPTATGWLFTGWYTDKDCTTLYDFDTPVSSNLLLYAGWEARVDQVDADFVLPWLHCKAGSAVSSLTPNHKEATLSASRILWKKNDGSGWVVMKAGEEFLPDTEYRAEFTVIADSKIPFAENVQATVRGSGTGVTCSLDTSGNLKIVYTKRLEYTTHTVSFDTEGKGDPIDTQTVEEGLTAVCPDDPVEEDFVFEGWYTDKAHTKRFEFDSPVVEDLTLYAHWTRPIHRVMITVPALIEGKTPPKTIYLSTEYGEEGLWYYEEETEWKKDNTRPLDYWHIFGRLQVNQDYTILNVAIPIAGNDWFFADDLEIVSSTGTVEVISARRPYAEVNIHVTVKSGGLNAIPVPSTLTVTFNTLGHGTVEPQTVTMDDSAIRPTDPADEGYTFTGWYTDEACTSLYDFDIPVTSDIILYAGWKTNSADDPDPDSPQTGDNGTLFLWITLLAVSGAAMGGTVFWSRKKKQY